MAHERKKKHGERKDKKMERMREAVEERKQNAQPHPSTDQDDIVPYKSGSAGDRARSVGKGSGQPAD